MRTIDDTPATQRYLMLAWRLSPAAWEAECLRVLNWRASAVRDAATDEVSELFDRCSSPTEAAIVVVHCYADVPEGTVWDVAFNPRDLDHRQSTRAILRLGVIWSREVRRSLSHGWHQVAVLDFPDGLPPLIEALPVDAQEQTRWIGLCTEHDFPQIQKELREAH